MKRLSRLHTTAVLSLVVFLWALPQRPVWIPMVALGVFAILTVWTFAVMHRLSRENLGPRYATNNLLLASLFTLFAGLGLLLWPYLVRTEIEKKTAFSRRGG